MGFSYSTHFLKSRGSVIRITFLEYRTKQINIFARRNVFIHYSLQIKLNNYIYFIGIFRDPVVTQFIVKVHVYRKITKSHSFESLPFLC